MFVMDVIIFVVFFFSIFVDYQDKNLLDYFMELICIYLFIRVEERVRSGELEDRIGILVRFYFSL